MTNFTYNNGVPATNNNPSADQPRMLENTQSTEQILAIDHISFSTDDGGTHKQVTFSSKNTPGAQTDPASTLYTASGTASTVADLSFRNQNAIYKLNIIRAWGSFATTSTVGAVALITGSNVASINYNGGGSYTVALTAGAVTGTSVAVLIGPSRTQDNPTWSYALNTLTIGNVAVTAGGIVSFAILQM